MTITGETSVTVSTQWDAIDGAVGYELSINGGAWIDYGNVLVYTFTELQPGTPYTVQRRYYDVNGVRSGVIDSASATTLPASVVQVNIDCGRNDSVLTNGWVGDAAWLTSVSSIQSFATTVDISGVVDPAPQVVWQTARIFNSEAPTFSTSGNVALIPGKTYRVRTLHNMDAPHTIGESVHTVYLNGTLTAPYFDPAYRESAYWDTEERAGGLNTGFIREYLGRADNNGVLVVKVNNAINNNASQIYICGLTIEEAQPIASFSAALPSDQTGNVVFTDTSTGSPTSWLYEFGDLDTSTEQNPVHKYRSAGTYTVTLVATNSYGASVTYSTDIVIPSTLSLTAVPSSLTATTRGASYSQALSVTGTTQQAVITLLSEAYDARAYTAIDTNRYKVQKRGHLPGLTIADNILSGTSSSAARRVIVDGDSTGQGFTNANPPLTANWTSAATLANLMPVGTTCYSTAVPGTTLAQCLAAFAANVAPLLSGDYIQKVYILCSGVNDILNGTSLGTMQANAQSIFTAAKNAGAFTIARSIHPSSGIAGADLTKLQAYNTSLAGMSGVDAYCNTALDTRTASPFYNVYNFDGGIHRTNLGYTAEGEQFFNIIQTAPNTGTGAVAVTYPFATSSIDLAGNALVKQYTLTVNP